MAIENAITLVGNLTDDPELRFTASGVPVANMRVAVNRRRYNRERNDWDETLDGYFSVSIWRDYAQNVADSLRRGDRVLVVGRLTSRSYDDKEGQTRWVTEIEADEICPSLRWATAKVAKVSRGGGGSYGGQGGGQGGAGGQGGGGQGGQGDWGNAPRSAPPDSDDVPF